MSKTANIDQKKPLKQETTKKKSGKKNKTNDAISEGLEQISSLSQCAKVTRKSKKKRGEEQKKESAITLVIDKSGENLSKREEMIDESQYSSKIGDGKCEKKDDGKVKKNSLLEIEKNEVTEQSNFNKLTNEIYDLGNLEADKEALIIKEVTKKKLKKKRLRNTSEKNELKENFEKLNDINESELTDDSQKNVIASGDISLDKDDEEKQKKKRKRRNAKKLLPLETSSSGKVIQDKVESINSSAFDSGKIDDIRSTIIKAVPFVSFTNICKENNHELESLPSCEVNIDNKSVEQMNLERAECNVSDTDCQTLVQEDINGAQIFKEKCIEEIKTTKQDGKLSVNSDKDREVNVDNDLCETDITNSRHALEVGNNSAPVIISKKKRKRKNKAKKEEQSMIVEKKECDIKEESEFSITSQVESSPHKEIGDKKENSTDDCKIPGEKLESKKSKTNLSESKLSINIDVQTHIQEQSDELAGRTVLEQKPSKVPEKIEAMVHGESDNDRNKNNNTVNLEASTNISMFRQVESNFNIENRDGIDTDYCKTPDKHKHCKSKERETKSSESRLSIEIHPHTYLQEQSGESAGNTDLKQSPSQISEKIEAKHRECGNDRIRENNELNGEAAISISEGEEALVLKNSALYKGNGISDNYFSVNGDTLKIDESMAKSSGVGIEGDDDFYETAIRCHESDLKEKSYDNSKKFKNKRKKVKRKQNLPEATPVYQSYYKSYEVIDQVTLEGDIGILENIVNSPLDSAASSSEVEEPINKQITKDFTSKNRGKEKLETNKICIIVDPALKPNDSNGIQDKSRNLEIIDKNALEVASYNIDASLAGTGVDESNCEHKPGENLEQGKKKKKRRKSKNKHINSEVELTNIQQSDFYETETEYHDSDLKQISDDDTENVKNKPNKTTNKQNLPEATPVCQSDYNSNEVIDQRTLEGDIGIIENFENSPLHFAVLRPKVEKSVLNERLTKNSTRKNEVKEKLETKTNKICMNVHEDPELKLGSQDKGSPNLEGINKIVCETASNNIDPSLVKTGNGVDELKYGQQEGENLEQGHNKNKRKKSKKRKLDSEVEVTNIQKCDHRKNNNNRNTTEFESNSKLNKENSKSNNEETLFEILEEAETKKKKRKSNNNKLSSEVEVTHIRENINNMDTMRLENNSETNKETKECDKLASFELKKEVNESHHAQIPQEKREKRQNKYKKLKPEIKRHNSGEKEIYIEKTYDNFKKINDELKLKVETEIGEKTGIDRIEPVLIENIIRMQKSHQKPITDEKLKQDPDTILEKEMNIPETVKRLTSIKNEQIDNEILSKTNVETNYDGIMCEGAQRSYEEKSHVLSGKASIDSKSNHKQLSNIDDNNKYNDGRKKRSKIQKEKSNSSKIEKIVDEGSNTPIPEDFYKNEESTCFKSRSIKGPDKLRISKQENNHDDNRRKGILRENEQVNEELDREGIDDSDEISWITINDSISPDKQFSSLIENPFVVAAKDDITDLRVTGFFEIQIYNLYEISEAEKRFAKLMESEFNTTGSKNCIFKLGKNYEQSEIFSSNDNNTNSTRDIDIPIVHSLTSPIHNFEDKVVEEIPDDMRCSPDIQRKFADNSSIRCSNGVLFNDSCNLSWSQVAAKEAKSKSLQADVPENQQKNKQKLESPKPVLIRAADRYSEADDMSPATVDSEGFTKYISKKEKRKQRSRTSSRNDEEETALKQSDFRIETQIILSKSSDPNENGEMSASVDECDSSGSDLHSLKEMERDSAHFLLETGIWIDKWKYHDAEVRYFENMGKFETHLEGNTLHFLLETGGIWMDKWKYHDAEVRFFESMGKFETLPPDINIVNASAPSSNGPPSPTGGKSNPDKEPRGELANGTERLTADLPSGLGGWSDYSTYISDEDPINLNSHMASTSGDSESIHQELNPHGKEDNITFTGSDICQTKSKSSSHRMKMFVIMIFMRLYLMFIYYTSGLKKIKKNS